MLPVGQGTIDFERALSACEDAGTEYIYIEQDRCNGLDPFGDGDRKYGGRQPYRSREDLEAEYQIYHMLGKNGVMGDLEPIKETKSHELLVVVEGVSKDDKVAEEATLIGTRQIFYARLPEVKGTAGTAAFVLDEVTKISDAYVWTMDHTVEVDDPLELFPISMIEIG